MRLRLEAEPGELRERGAELLAALAQQLEQGQPELAKALQTALPKVRRRLPQKALRPLQERFLAGYHRAMQAAMDEVVALVAEQEAPGGP